MKKRYIIIIIFLAILSFSLINGFEVKSIFNKSDKVHEIKNEFTEQTINIEEIKKETRIESIDILACGDIMFHMPQVRSAYKGNGIYDFNPVFKHVQPYIENADISLVNFETVTAGDELGFSGFPEFNSPKSSLEALKNAGFDIISTANNHSLDKGKNGIISTLNKIEDLNLKSIGTYKDENKIELIEEKSGIKLGFLSYTYGLNGMDFKLTKEELSYMINLIDEQKIKEDIQNLKEKVDSVIVFIHWGNEYKSEISQYQINLGHKMVDWGANIIFGSHPHVIQRSEIVTKDGKDNFIIYSMGNFLSNQRLETMGNPYTEDGVMVRLNIKKNFDKNETIIEEISYIPTWIYRYFEGNKYIYEILPVEEVINGGLEIELNQNDFSRIEKSFKDTLERVKVN